VPGHFTFYTDSINNDFALFSEAESKHISQVLRFKIGDQIEFTNGKGRLYNGRVHSIEKRLVKAIIESVEEYSVPQVSVAVGILKNSDRMEWLVEKATELGVNSIFWMSTDNTERTKLNIEKHRKTAISAMKQSHTAWIPNIEVVNFSSILKSSKYSAKLIAYCSDGLNSLKADDFKDSTLILIGPEGDFSNNEVSDALKNGFKSIGLGNRILRTETAVLKALSIQ